MQTFGTLVDAATLHAHLDDPSWIVIDCRHSLADFSLGRRQYEEAHVPGAFFADMERDLSGDKTGHNGRHPLPEPETFAGYLRALGVDDRTQIVAYDAGAEMSAARLWFLAKWIGHDAVALLDGGLTAWKAAGFETTGAVSQTTRTGNLSVHLRPQLVVDAAYVLEHLRSPSVCVVDARGRDRFRGENETMDPVAGHIPGAANRPFKENFGPDLRFKSPAELRERFGLVSDPTQVVHQCGSGVSAAVNMLAMEIAGQPGSRVYAGSWSEWIADPSRPITLGDDASA